MNPDPKNSRDFLVEAVKIAEGKTSMPPCREHVRALYDVWTTHLKMQAATKTAIGRLAQMAREGKPLPTKEELPHLIEFLTRDIKEPK